MPDEDPRPLNEDERPSNEDERPSNEDEHPSNEDDAGRDSGAPSEAGAARANGSDRRAESEESAAPRRAADPKPSWWVRLVRPSRAQVVVAVVLALVAYGAVTQVRSQNDSEDYSSARREDLIQLLDQLTNETRRLESEATELETTRRELESGADAEKVAREEARKRAEVLGILAGTLPAEGPGIRMVITDPEAKVTPEILLNVIQEMRDAGGEVIEVNDEIRLVASSWVARSPDGIVIDEVLVHTPITIEVIGDPHALEEAARFRGGLVSEITGPSVGGRVDLVQIDQLQISSLHTPKANQYAQPASEPPR